MLRLNIRIRPYSKRVNIAHYLDNRLDLSIQTMDNVMAILREMEPREHRGSRPSQFLVALQHRDTEYLNRYTQAFGEEIYRYSVLYEFNSRPYLQSNKWLLDGFDRNIEVVLNRFMARAILPPSNSFFRRYSELSLDSRLTYAQTLARYFVLNPVHCKHRLQIDIQHAAKEIISYDKRHRWDALVLDLATSDRAMRGDPLVLRTRLPQSNPRNALAFLAKDASVVQSLATISRGEPDTSIVVPAMELDEMEGRLAFTITCKQLLFKIQDCKEDAGVVEPPEATPTKTAFFLEDETQYWEGPGGVDATLVAEDTPVRRRMPFNFARVVPVNRERYTALPAPHVVPQREVQADFASMDDRALLANLLENRARLRDIKVAVAHKSGLPYRMMENGPGRQQYQLAWASSERVEAAVADNNDEAIKDILAGHFDRYFARFYGAHALEAEAWVVSLADALGRNALLVNDTLLNDAVTTFKTRFESCKVLEVTKGRERRKGTEKMAWKSWHEYGGKVLGKMA